MFACAVLLFGYLAGAAHDLFDLHDAQHGCVVCSLADRLDAPLAGSNSPCVADTPELPCVAAVAGTPPFAPRPALPEARAPPVA